MWVPSQITVGREGDGRHSTLNQPAKASGLEVECEVNRVVTGAPPIADCTVENLRPAADVVITCV